ncbi:MAG TPA: Ig-like domain-containing protein [Kiritimatiellia bacterium]|nr:Ig-like domain-containing protein [Kiritimatiellia bacterium]
MISSIEWFVRRVSFLVLMVLTCSFCCSVHAATLSNTDFETGNLSNWTTRVNQMKVSACTNDSYNRNYSACITGKYASATWITNSIYQTTTASAGDTVVADGFVFFKRYAEAAAAGTGYVKVSLSSPFVSLASNSVTFGITNNAWTYFNLRGFLFGVANGGFEQDLVGWGLGCDNLQASIVTNVKYSGTKALRMSGGWTGWGWNEAQQIVTCNSGDVLEARGKVYLQDLETTAPWVVAGIKLERVSGGWGAESTVNAASPEGVWSNLAFTATAPSSGDYIMRVMVCGGEGGSSTGTVYFDDIQLWKQSGGTATTYNVTLSLDYYAHSGGAAYTSSAEVYMDAVTVKGSLANLVNPTNIMTSLRTEASAIGTSTSAVIPTVVYPAINTFGLPGEGVYPSYVEAAIPGWRFKYMTNNVTITCTNTIKVWGIPEYGAGYVEMDQYVYCAKNPHKERGQPLEIVTNGPYFAIGTKDGKSSEFGSGPFPEEYTYVVGSPLSNFPKRISTWGSGQWPSTLHIVFQENFSQFSNGLWNKHFVVASVVTNGAAVNAKAARIFLQASKTGASNDVDVQTHELHFGWAAVTSCYGLVDYSNVTYQAHNEVTIRAPWIYNHVDDGTGWYMQQSPRGSATIEPLELYALDKGTWIQRIYDQNVFTWSHAGAGVASMFDDDNQVRLSGPASYHVGVKIGHAYQPTPADEVAYPEVLTIRGCGYFRMADYEGVMAGSFRPMAQDIFSLTKGEDPVLIPKAYTRVVPRTTPTNGLDDSYAQIFANIRSKTNNTYIGVFGADLHFSPSEAASNGCYFDLSQETWAHKAVVLTNDGPLSCFAQVSMYWRGDASVNGGQEGHDVDVVMVKRTNGEWITHQLLNPPTNIYHRTLSRFGSNETVYLMQQDRGPKTYEMLHTEMPYNRASAFEITLLSAPGTVPLNLDIYEQNTRSEIMDNVDIACNVATNLTRGQKLAYKYRYRTVYAPGVIIQSPNTPDGGEGWNDNSYRITFNAVDGHGYDLLANVYYGNGKDNDWRQIGTNIAVAATNPTAICDWNVSGVATGAYYVKVTAQRVGGGKIGFDVSNSRLQIGATRGFPNNGTRIWSVVTNAFGYLGQNTDFETGGWFGWAWTSDGALATVSTGTVYQGRYSCRQTATNWIGWSWNDVWQSIDAQPGEKLHVSGKVFIASMQKLGTNWLSCGIRIETTNGIGTGVEFSVTSATGVWQNVEFDHYPVQARENLRLWVAGYDATNVDVYFDAISITSTNVHPVITNFVNYGYWLGDSAVDVSTHNVLSFMVGGSQGVEDLAVWVKDAAGVSNRVFMSNYIGRVVSTAQRVDIPWRNFTTINKAAISNISFTSSASNDAVVTSMRSITVPFLVSSVARTPPQIDEQGVPYYYPGQTVTNTITISNMYAVAQTGLAVQVDQEYGETLYWWDDSSPKPTELFFKNSEKTRKGDRLCNGFEQNWTAQTVPASGRLVLTGVYKVPVGNLVTINTNEPPWYAYRNIKARAQVHVVARRASGDNVYDNDMAGCYAVGDEVSPLPRPPTGLKSSVVTTNAGKAIYTVSWSPVTGATGYQLQEDEDSYFGTPNSYYLNATSRVMTQTVGGVYYYKVATSTNGHYGMFCVPIAVTVSLNRPPVANDQSVSTPEEVAKAITLTATDPDGNPLTYAIVSNPSHGALSGTAPNVTYTPYSNYYGADSFTFRANDGKTNSNTATVSITVTPVNDAPTANGQSVSTPEDTTRAITLTGSDPETNALSYEIVTYPANGSLWGTLPNLTYGPSLNFNGSDSFTFRVNDGSLTSAPATVSITVTAVNDAPVADNQTVYTAINMAKAITLTATDPETNALTYSIVSSPSHGVLSGSAPSVTYTPFGEYYGNDSFTFRANDGLTNGTIGTVSLVVTAKVVYVDDSNTSGTEDGSQAYPYNTIVEGVGVAGNHSIVYVAAGYYDDAVALTGRTNVTLVGENENAILTNALSYKFGLSRCRLVTLKGFTLSGGQNGISLNNCDEILICTNTIVNIQQYAYNSGGAFSVGYSTLRIEDNVITNCYGGQRGGIGYFYDVGMTVMNNDFINCTAWNSAGGLWIACQWTGRVNRIKNNYFYQNTADYSGAIDLYGEYLNNTWIDHNVFVSCGADYSWAGAIKVQYLYNGGGGTSDLRIVNNVFDGVFTASSAPEIGVYVTTGKVYMANNVMVGPNWAGSYAAYNAGSSNDVVVEYNDIYQYVSGIYNCAVGAGNITNAPSFVGSGDYHLQVGSPCINAGNPAAFYNDADGSRNDMGVFGGNY